MYHLKKWTLHSVAVRRKLIISTLWKSPPTKKVVFAHSRWWCTQQAVTTNLYKKNNVAKQNSSQPSDNVCKITRYTTRVSLHSQAHLSLRSTQCMGSSMNTNSRADPTALCACVPIPIKHHFITQENEKRGTFFHFLSFLIPIHWRLFYTTTILKIIFYKLNSFFFSPPISY